jgi:hypothetical protein
MLEEGVLGLGMWVLFIGWLTTRRFIVPVKSTVGGRLAWFVTTVYFLMACLGIGLLTSAPQSFLLVLAAGWASSGVEFVDGRIRLRELAAKEHKVAAW